mmetsp:Transcript_28518/g.44917  ORF Transcript_28518/g.44917 Transcript_28518/m.44917 type:complete len:556 (+) Transcript_28518:114-1781(+)
MTLFATLTKAAGSSSSSSNNNSCSPPEAIQLHGNKFINFLSAKTVNLDDDDDHNDDNVSDLKHFSALSYQAVQTQREDVGTKKRQHLRPDLGIWDCRIQSPSAAATDNTAMLLQRVIINKKGDKLNNNKKEQGNEDEDDKKEAADEIISNDDDSIELPPTVVLTVDTTNPNSVQPSFEQMRNVLLGMMNEETSSSNNNNNSNQLLFSRESIQISTSMKVLQSSPFGVTKITESVGSSLQDSSSKRVAIIIAAIVASSSSNNNDDNDGKTAADEFKERQAKSLVLYHLHKFALECDCTLCFVRGDDDTDGDDKLLAEGIQNLNIGDDTVEKNENGDKGSNDINEAQKKKAKSASLSIDEFGKVIRRVAMGLSPVEEQQDVTNEEEAKTNDDAAVVAASSEISAIHAPGSHDAELIHGAYLRNASCEGYWDASKDDLIVALSPPPQLNTNDTLQQQQKEESKKGTASSSGGGDEEWLSKLAASVGLTPEAITTSGGDAAATTTVPSSSTTPSGKKSPKRERPGVKKRVSRVASSKTKDGKPKDQKAVLNFFDDLLKK